LNLCKTITLLILVSVVLAPSSFVPLRGISAPAAQYLVIVVIDGCRPDYLQLTDVPNLRYLMSNGVTYSKAWLGQLVANTPPGHATVTTGSLPKNQGVIGFAWRDPATGGIAAPTTIEAVSQGRLGEAIVSSGAVSIPQLIKQAYPDSKILSVGSSKYFAAAAMGNKYADYIVYTTRSGKELRPGGVEGQMPPSQILNDPDLRYNLPASPIQHDSWPITVAAKILERERPKVMLINLPEADAVGHQTGGINAPEAMAQIIANVDVQIGRLVDAYRRLGILDQTLFAVTSDHGMIPNTHLVPTDQIRRAIEKAGTTPLSLGGDTSLHTYLRDQSKSKQAAENIASLNLAGIDGVYYRVKSQDGYAYLPTTQTSSKISRELDEAYRYLFSTYANEMGPDIAAAFDENTVAEQKDGQMKGRHGGLTWGVQSIPMILAGPGVKKGYVSEMPARLIDLAPTVLALTGISTDRMDGIVLSDALVDSSPDLLKRQLELAERLTRLQDALVTKSKQDLAQAATTSVFPRIAYSADYLAGTRDSAGNFIGGTEIMNLALHGGKLYAGVGYWMDLPYLKNKENYPWTGAQILVKDSADSSWRLEHSLGPQTLRVDALKSIVFTTDYQGNKLPQPVSMLVASSIDYANKGQWVWTRDDKTGVWTKTLVAKTDAVQYGRSFGLHKDKMTGIDCLFVGTSTQQIYRGSYDPNAPGKIRWEGNPEFAANAEKGRAMAFTVANNVLYASVADAVYRREDGLNPTWTVVYRWQVSAGTRFPDMRGLTTVRSPDGDGESILGARETSGVIERIDPSRGHKVTVELDVRRYFTDLWGRARGHLIAYNNMVPFTLPLTEERVHLISLQTHHPDQAYDRVHSFYLVRRQDGSYLHLEVNDPRLTNHPELRAVRCFETSPFNPDEFYLGGFDCNNLESHNTAWIFKATLSATLTSTVSTTNLGTTTTQSGTQSAGRPLFNPRERPILTWVIANWFSVALAAAAVGIVGLTIVRLKRKPRTLTTGQ